MNNKIYKNKAASIAFINTALLFIYAFIVSGLYYETNDDATLSNIANGAFGPGTQNLIYINIWLSYLIKFLHTIMPGINFVVLLQLIVMFISIWTIITIIIKKYNNLYGVILSNLLFFPFATELISKFQYVKTSTVIIVAGLMVIAVNLSAKNRKIVGGYILVIFGCRIRFESFIAAGALSAFTLLLYFFRLEKEQKAVAVKQMLVLFVIVFSLEGINSLYYAKSPQWAEYTAYNKARTNLTDYKENYIPLYFNDVMKRGFSENDVHLIYSSNYFDNTFFDTETINKAADSIGKKPVKDIIADYLHIVINLFINVNEKFYKIGFILSIILVFTCRRKNFIYRFGTMAMFALLLLYLMTVNRFMSRIEAMMVIAAAVNVVMCYSPAQIRNVKMSVISGTAVALLIILSLPVQLQYRKGKYDSYVQASAKYENVVQDMSAQKENLYLFDSVQTDCFAGYDVFNPRTTNFFSNICPTGSWYSNSIYTNSVLEQFGMESPLIDSVNRSNVFISNEHIDLKLKYVQEHYNEDVYAVKVTDNGLCDYQFKMN